MKARIVRLTTIIAAALPIILVAWAVVGMFTPELGMHDGSG